MCFSPASCRYLSLALAAGAAATAAGASVTDVVPLAAPAAAGQLCRPSSSPRSASVKDMDNNDDDGEDFDNNGGGLWQHQ